MAQPPGVRQSFPASDADRGRRLDLFLAARLPSLTRSRIQQLIEQGKAGIERNSPHLRWSKLWRRVRHA